jgi:hypothetical protein
MSNTRPLVSVLVSALTLSAVPLIVTITVGVKVSYLVPLLKRWSEEPSLQYSKHQFKGQSKILGDSLYHTLADLYSNYLQSWTSLHHHQ